MPKQTKKFKRRLLANKGLAVSWNTADRLVFITLRGGVTMGFAWQDAMRIADQLLMGAEAVETASEEEADDDFDPELDQRLRDQLNSEVSATMGMGGVCEAAGCGEPTGPAAVPPPATSAGRLAEELGSARQTLAEILQQAGDYQPVGSLQKTPRDERDAPWTRMTPAFPGVVKADGQTQINQAFEGTVTGFNSPPRPHYETLMLGLAEHPTDAGKILINGKPLSLGHARNYGIAMHRIIEAQQAKAFGRDLQATVSTPEPPAEVPMLRAD